MFSNYFKVALRNLSRQKSFTILNVLGLAVGISSVLLIYRIVTFELSFNRHFAKLDRMVRVVTTEFAPDGEQGYTRGMPLPAMTAAKSTVSQFAAAAKTKEYWPTVLVPNPTGGPALKKFNMGRNKISFFVEPEFFQIFDFQWLSGDAQKALQSPNTLVLSRQMAERCFGSWNQAQGQTLLVDNTPMTVEGVVSDPPLNCDFPFVTLVSYKTLTSDPEKYEYREDWGGTSSNDQLFALLHSADQFDAANEQVKLIGKKEYSDNGKAQKASKFHLLQPLSELHYDDRFGTSATAVVPKSRLWILSSIGVLVLVMACFNFINLSTAQALRRSKEVGVRKTLGGSRGHLFNQFMSETGLIVLAAVVLGVALATLASPLLVHISEVPASWPFLSLPGVWAFLGVLAVLLTLLSGSYPALVQAGFNPVRALKNNVSRQASGGAAVRKGLVVCQFMIAQALLVGTIITLGQLNYLRNMELGFNKDLVYTFGVNGDSLSQSRLDGMKQRLLQLPGVESVAYGSDQPSSGSTWSTNFALGRGSEDQQFNTSIKFCDADFLKTYGLQMVAGRWLEPSDTAKEYVVNMTLLKKAGISNPESVLDQELRLGGNNWRKVVGVVRDFHSHSAHNELEPLVMTCSRKRFYTTGVKISPRNITATTAAIQGVFDETHPEQVFDPTFFDESIADFYLSENRFSNTCKGFAFLAILISCLGLFGLATHAAQQRTKEIGVRKVLGANVSGLVGLLAKDFLKLVLIAIVIATPLAYYFMRQWLADFVYRIDMQVWMFLLAGLAATAVAFVAIAGQAIRAALVNPVKSLRSE